MNVIVWWLDHWGQTIMTAQPGGLVMKQQYDGAGRTTKTFTTDGGGDTAWSDADDVTSDIVLTQLETTYDAAGNVLLTTARDRFHDETATGALGDATTSPKARVSSQANYYDKANRLTDSVDVGTNGGSAYTRPSSVPSRSDTVLVTSQTYNDAGWVETTTDPRGIQGKRYYDNLGQTIKTIEAYVDGTPSNSDDKTTEYTYDGAGHMKTLKAWLTGGAYQETEFVYGVTTATGSDLNSNDVLAATKYPDKSTGAASNSEKESYTVNALGQRKALTDRNGSVHTYSYDVLGRTLSDAVTTLGSGVDGAVRRLETAYNTQGLAFEFTSFDAASGGNVVNQVQQVHNGLGQLTTEYQSHSGVVNTSTTPKVQYAYSEMASGANHSRLTSITYPNGKVLTYNYGTGLDSNVSRLSSLSDTSGTLESYSYLGFGMVVIRAHPQPGVDQTYVKQTGESNGDAGDPYTGLDRFGRVVDQRWLKTSDGSHTDRFKYGYDRNGNRLYRTNELNHNFDELYHADGASNGYDLLNQLTEFQRGTLSDTNSDGVPDTVATASRSQSWSFDALGNWSSLTTDGTVINRTHNKQNQVTSVGSTSLSFDANGNMTTDENGKTLVYDAWNRLAAYKNGTTVLESYQYDGLNRRGVESSETARDLYYSSVWQVLEERVGGAAQAQYVWGPGYVDAMVLRERDADASSGNGLEERLWAQQDTSWNVTTLLSASGVTSERMMNDPYGGPIHLTAVWGGLANSAYGWSYSHQGGRVSQLTGLFDFRRRFYSSGLGRWASIDPLGYKSGFTDLYDAYGNNPRRATDPYGLMPNQTDAISLDEFIRYVERLESLLEESLGRKPTCLETLNRLVLCLKGKSGSQSGPTSGASGIGSATSCGFGSTASGGSFKTITTGKCPSWGNKPVGFKGWVYIYTTQKGWIDMAHFLYSANAGHGQVVTLIGGYSVESAQYVFGSCSPGTKGKRSSAFTVEDIDSNQLGSLFRQYIGKNGCSKLSVSLGAFLSQYGATDPTNSPSFKSLPLTEAAWEASDTQKAAQIRFVWSMCPAVLWYRCKSAVFRE